MAQVVNLPCCPTENKDGSVSYTAVKVTQRTSKLKERPRYHSCPNCGKRYKIGSNYNPKEIL